jgi:lipopolysaccharide/colanic/teichoic acid biosynthesis glycosyltransferase
MDATAHRRGYLRLKRAFDIAICLAAMPLMLPLMGLCALAIRLDSPGPIVFRQQRTGRHGLRFDASSGRWSRTRRR